MKIGVIGLGSMGKRRVRDLLKIGCEVVGFDISPERRNETHGLFGIKVYASIDDFIECGIDAAVISTPTDTHYDYYCQCFDRGINFFSEANIFTPKPEWFIQKEKESGAKSFPSATWDFHPIFQLTKKIVEEIGYKNVNTVHYHYGGYLPLWHPWESYANYYAGHKKTSAAREMVPFELEWLCYVFGKIKAVSAIIGKMSTWDTDMDDTYLLQLEFESGLYGTLNIELHQTAPFRYGRISCYKASLELDMLKPEIKYYDLVTNSWKYIQMPGVKVMSSFNLEDIYASEMENFFNALKGKAKYIKTWDEDRHLSDVLYAAELSFKKKCWVTIKDIKDKYDGLTWD